MVFSDTRGVMVDSGRNIDQGFADATKGHNLWRGSDSGVFFSHSLCLTLSPRFWSLYFHDTLFMVHVGLFSFYLDGRFHWNGMWNVHGGFCHLLFKVSATFCFIRFLVSISFSLSFFFFVSRFRIDDGLYTWTCSSLCMTLSVLFFFIWVPETLIFMLHGRTDLSGNDYFISYYLTRWIWVRDALSFAYCLTRWIWVGIGADKSFF